MTIPYPTWPELKNMIEDWRRDRVWYCQDCHLIFKESDAPDDELSYVLCPNCDKHESLIRDRKRNNARETEEETA